MSLASGALVRDLLFIFGNGPASRALDAALFACRPVVSGSPRADYVLIPVVTMGSRRLVVEMGHKRWKCQMRDSKYY
jgi:hypothetical protein